MEMWSNLGSGTLMATIIFLGTMAPKYLPPELLQYFSELLRRISRFLSFYITLVIEENKGIKVSDLYESVQIYLSTMSSSDANRLKLSKPKNAKAFCWLLSWWSFYSRQLKQPAFSLYGISDEKRQFELTFHKRDKAKIFESYLPHVLSEAKIMELRNRHRKIYTNKGGKSHYYRDRNRVWTPVVFDHPATFETLALDPEVNDDIMQDLRKFSQREKYYKKVGRAWKRGYFLYGPPGTGKSSMIAAISNSLEYDIYDLELTGVKNNTELRKLLIGTTNKSVIVIEDIDCSLDLSERKKKAKKESKEEENPAKDEEDSEESKVTLSGVLNFTDGLWSCCGSERIIIFTTNHADRLDPALLRSGRMDKHIHLSFCTFPAFKVLAKNYLGVEDHHLFEKVEVLMKEAQITPADVAEELMRASDDPSAALEKLIEALRRAIKKAAVKTEISPETEISDNNSADGESPTLEIRSEGSSSN